MELLRFQPNSIQGKKLLCCWRLALESLSRSSASVAREKCNHLEEENAEIARQLSEERLQVLRIQLSAERRKRLQLRARIAQLDEYAEKVGCLLGV